MDHDVRREMQDAYKGMTIPERQCFIQALNDEYVLSTPYYSEIMFSAARAGGPAAGTYTVAEATQARAFSYAFDTGIATTAGFPANMVASRAETNLAVASQTNAAESVEIFGLAVQPLPAFPTLQGGVFVTDVLSDARLLGVIDECCSVSLELNAGRETYQFGTISMMPGAGGLEGSGYDSLGEQSIPGARPQFGFITNGRPFNDNFFRMPEGVVWLPAGEPDSLLTVRFILRRAAVVFAGGDRQNIAGDEAAAGGIRGYVYPPTVGCSMMVFTHGKVFSKRSRVS